jgi:dTDP-4-dehydrorhamnose 3,5-epimerase
VKFRQLSIPGVALVEPTVFGDQRGFFMETWERRKFGANGIDLDFVQDNQSLSVRGTLRGIHYQIKHPQGKLVRAVQGEIFDVAVDLRRQSPTLGQWLGERLSAENKRMLWIPPGFGHGFLVLSDLAVVQYKCTDYYAAEFERSIRWDDSTLAIEWPLERTEAPLLSARDSRGVSWAQAELYS